MITAVALSGCAASTPGKETVTVTETVTVSPTPPLETDVQYASRLLNATTAYLGILEIYLDGTLDGYDDDDFGEAAWSAGQGANESASFRSKLNESKWAPSSNATAPFHEHVVAFAAAEQVFMRDLQTCAQGHAVGEVVPACDKTDANLKANNRARQVMRAEAERWNPAWGAALA